MSPATEFFLMASGAGALVMATGFWRQLAATFRSPLSNPGNPFLVAVAWMGCMPFLAVQWVLAFPLEPSRQPANAIVCALLGGGALGLAWSYSRLELDPEVTRRTMLRIAYAAVMLINLLILMGLQHT